MRQSLSEVVFSDAKPVSMSGTVDVIIRNIDGSIHQHERKKNIICDSTRLLMSRTDTSITSAINVFIHQNSSQIIKQITSLRSVISGTFAQVPSISLDGPNRLWTFTTTFAAPPSNRTFQTIGLTRSLSTSGFTNLKEGVSGIMAMTVLGSPISQTTLQTAEIVYRIALTRT